MKKYLICSSDEPVTEVRPHWVVADSASAALGRFLREVHARTELFREDVLDRCVNMSFVERFYLATDQEKQRFDESGVVGTEPEIVKSRVRVYFAARPDLGDIFLRYMDSGDRSLIEDEMFEFIATASTEREHGYMAVDLDSLECLA